MYIPQHFFIIIAYQVIVIHYRVSNYTYYTFSSVSYIHPMTKLYHLGMYVG